MTKEEQIEEMLQAVKNAHLEERPHDYIKDPAKAICAVLYETGYRKADEVRQETAREILCEFWVVQWGQSELDNVCIRLAEKYGVDMENVE